MAVARDKVLVDVDPDALRTTGRWQAVFPQQAWTIGIHYRRELHTYLLRRLQHRQELDDIKQEVYMRLLRMGRMDCVREPLAYLYAIAANVVADFSLAERRRGHVASDSDAVDNWAENPDQALPDDLAERMSLQRELENALNQLPPAQAAALTYHYQDGMSCDEIAKKLGLSTKSIDKYLTRGKAKMRLMLWDNDPAAVRSRRLRQNVGPTDCTNTTQALETEGSS